MIDFLLQRVIPVFSVALLFLSFSGNVGAQATQRRPPAPDYAPDPSGPLFIPADATLIAQTDHSLSGRPRGWSKVWLSRELENGKASSPDQATGFAIYRQIGGDNPPARMLSNVRLKRFFVPFTKAGNQNIVVAQMGEQKKDSDITPNTVFQVILRCAEKKPCIKIDAWMGYPDPETGVPLQDSEIIEISGTESDAKRLIEMISR
jgi:hypothetical protein